MYGEILASQEQLSVIELEITNLGKYLVRYFRYTSIPNFIVTYTFISGASTPFRIKRKNFQIYFNPISSIRLQALFDLNRLFKDI